jgi:hypothetical protein
VLAEYLRMDSPSRLRLVVTVAEVGTPAVISHLTRSLDSSPPQPRIPPPSDPYDYGFMLAEQ